MVFLCLNCVTIQCINLSPTLLPLLVNYGPCVDHYGLHPAMFSGNDSLYVKNADSKQTVSIGVGAGGAAEAVAPLTKLLGEQLVHPAPPVVFCNLQLKVTLQTVRLYV